MTQEELKMKLTEWRHYLHAHPETAFEETNTAAFVAEKLREIGLTVHEHIGGTGVVADLKVGDGPQVIGLHADMDAINLKETTGLPYQSLNPGKMHGCGHDGHTTALLGAMLLLSERRNFNGTVRCIFQPAEEPGKGSRAMRNTQWMRFMASTTHPFFQKENCILKPAALWQVRTTSALRSREKASTLPAPIWASTHW